MANIKRTVTDINGNYAYSALQTHCSHSSAAGAFQVHMKGSLIESKKVSQVSTTVRAENGDVYLFEEV